jgi:nucleoid DNA-binding protein
MAAKKKTAPKKAPAKKAASKKANVAAKAPAKLKAITSAQTKAQVIDMIAGETKLTKKDVATVFSTMQNLIERSMMKRGSGEFTIPDAGVKIKKIRKTAAKARNGHNPYTGEAMKIPSKPARNIVRVSSLKGLKEIV